MSSEIIKVPDIGGSSDVEIIEVTVAVGDVISAEDTMITLESDKASMDVPAPKGGKVVKILVKEGDTVSEGDDILELEAEGESDAPAEEASNQREEREREEARWRSCAVRTKMSRGRDEREKNLFVARLFLRHEILSRHANRRD